MKVVIAEGGPAGNVGSMALIENALKIIRSKYPNCDISILCSDAESVERALRLDELDYNVKVLNELFKKPKRNKLYQIFWLVTTIFWFFYSRVLLLFSKKISWAFCGQSRIVLKEIEESEYVYCIGAERINDVYYKVALLSLYLIETYIKMGKKVCHMSLTIGPVFYKSTISKAKKVFNECYAIFVRDTKSYNILKEWNCKAPYQFSTFDIALLQNVKSERINTLMSEFAIEENFIGVSVISWGFSHVAGPARQSDYVKSHAEVLDYIIEKYNRQIVFTPTVICKGYAKWDTEVADDVVKLMKHKDKVVNIQRLLTPCELAALYTKCYFSIVTRMHASILCSGAGGKPIIAVNYLYKLREYMKNIDFEEYSVDIDYVNERDLIRFVDNMFANYEGNKNRLNRRIEEMKADLQSKLEKI